MELEKEESIGLRKMQTETGRIAGQVKKTDLNVKGFKDQGGDFTEEISAIESREEEPNASFTSVKPPAG